MKTVALVGRPNVGKSRLFNRLVGRRTAIVEGTPGITRDRVESIIERNGRHIRWIDTGGIGATGALSEQVVLQAAVAVEAADLVILVTDIRDGLQPLDSEIANMLRSARKVMIAANKADDATSERSWTEFTALGFDPVLPVSAEHGRGFGEFEDEVMKLLGADDSEPPMPPTVRIAIVGRPNVGKSSLLNRILGKERAIVSEVPGTTRDALEDIVEIEIEPLAAEEEELPDEAEATPDSRPRTPDSRLRIALVDTAGIRKRRRDYDLLESIMVSRTRDAVLRCDVAIVVLDAVEGLTDQDAKILRAVFDMGKGAVIALNKWDAVTEKDYDETVRVMKIQLGGAAHVPLKSISAKTGLRVRSLLLAARDVAQRTLNSVKTGDLIRCLGDLNVHAPRGMALKYGIQKSAAPPTFLLFGAKNPPSSFRSLVQKSIRSLGDFDGVPINLEFRK